MPSAPEPKAVCAAATWFGDSCVRVILRGWHPTPTGARSGHWNISTRYEGGKLPAGVSAPKWGPDATGGVGWIFGDMRWSIAAVNADSSPNCARLLGAGFKIWAGKPSPMSPGSGIDGRRRGRRAPDCRRPAESLTRAMAVSLSTVNCALRSPPKLRGGGRFVRGRELAEAGDIWRCKRQRLPGRRWMTSIISCRELYGGNGVPCLLARCVREYKSAPENAPRHQFSELNGEGQKRPGGVVILRSGKTPAEVISAVKDKLETPEKQPAGKG